LGNFFGPFLLGPLFDSIGRRRMISGTYAMSGLLLIGAAVVFRQNAAGAVGQVIWFNVIFFIASCAACSAYLSVREVFPLDIRAFAISMFYAAGPLIGGVGAPILFARLIQTGSRAAVFQGYVAGAILMLIGALAEARLGVDAERRSLESITPPLQSE